MSYSDFTLESVIANFGLTVGSVGLFENLKSEIVPTWLVESLQRGRAAAPMVSEKARSEILVMPVLMGAREIASEAVSIFSGQRLDVDPARGLTGECDFILASGETVPVLRSPILMIVEAKKGDVEASIGQCVAQMVGGRLFNEHAGVERPMYGCVTTGDVWQFLILEDSRLGIERQLYFINNVGAILTMLKAILRSRSTH